MNNSGPSPFERKMQAVEAACAGQTPLRFAVLHHTGVPIPHFDLLLELPGWDKLLTWRVLMPVEVWGAGGETEIGALSVEDHRPLYLNYEGPVSGGRGAVRRIAHGTALALAADSGRLDLQLLSSVATRVSLPLS